MSVLVFPSRKIDVNANNRAALHHQRTHSEHIIYAKQQNPKIKVPAFYF